MVIKRIGPLSCAKIVGTLHLFLGLVVGGAISLIAVAGGFGTDAPEIAGIGAIIGLGSIVFFPVLYGCIGFVTALVGAWLYNLMSGFVGGVQMDVQ